MRCRKLVHRALTPAGIALFKSFEEHAINLVRPSLLSSSLGRSIARIRYRPSSEHVGREINYRRFIILAHARSGSNLLTYSLRQHSQIVCKDEVFHNTASPIKSIKKNARSKWLLAIRNSHATEFIDQYIFNPHPVHVRAVGFKIFPNQYCDPRFKPAVSRILESPDTLVIRLHRYNKLEVYLSLLRANTTGRWIKTPEDNIYEPPIHIDASDCENAFCALNAADKIFENLCITRPNLSITYRDLELDFAGTLNQVQIQLGVEPEHLTPALKKQRITKIQDSIINYRELKSYFKNTQWNKYFEI